MIRMLTTQNLILSAPSLQDLSAINDFETRNNNHLKNGNQLTQQIIFFMKKIKNG